MRLDLSGKRFGRLVIQSFVGIQESTGRTLWSCLCDCGKVHTASGSEIKRGKTKSCGCLRDEQRGKNLKGKLSLNFKHGRSDTKEFVLWSHAKARAKHSGLDFTLELSDVYIPAVCPLLDIPLKRDRQITSPDSPSLDRIDPTKGYVKGNVWVISHKANTMKSDGSLTEHRLLVNNWAALEEGFKNWTEFNRIA